jgi:hypothetical protein
MNRYTNRLTRLVLSVLAAVLVAGCGTASYSAKSNKAPNFTTHISRVSVWSDIDNVPLLSRKGFGMSDTFANFFSVALKANLANAGATAEVRGISPGDKLADLVRFEQQFSPEYRLMIAVPKYHLMDTNGRVSMADMKLDLSLFTVKDNRRVWRGELMMDGGLVRDFPWRQEGAQRLAQEMVMLLQKDGLVH